MYQTETSEVYPGVRDLNSVQRQLTWFHEVVVQCRAVVGRLPKR